WRAGPRGDVASMMQGSLSTMGGARPVLVATVAVVMLLAVGEARAQIAPSDQTMLLDRHNQRRSEVALGQLAGQPAAANMARMQWDGGLAQPAQAWANQCTFAHNPNRGIAGENLFLATGALTSSLLQQGFDLWFAENGSYTYGPVSGSDFSHGHYTQLVWSSS